MEKILIKESIGEFFSKMYDANRGKNMEVTLKLDDNKIQIFDKMETTFEDIHLIDRWPDVDDVINSLSE